MQSSLPRYTRHSVVPLEEGLAAIGAFVQNRRNRKAVLNGLTINCHSLRLLTFYHKGLTCVECGAQATHFALETNQPDTEEKKSYHMNLWGKNADGEDVLFTHDHIIARALDGLDELENTQTMCYICNWAKGRVEGVEKARRDKEKRALETANK